MNRFENGFHSFKKSISYLTKNGINEFDLKEIIINFHHSIEVLFKYILFNKHSLFIYNDIDKLIEQNFNKKFGIDTNNAEKKNIEFYTITFDETIKRIIIICDEAIDKYTYNKFKMLNKFRNSLIHDELNLIKEEVEQLIISILPTVIMILQRHLIEDNEREFIEFIEDKEISRKLNELYINNNKWRIITIINLLKAYKTIDYSKISVNDNKHMKKMLSLLGCEVSEDDILTNIDGSYYISAISYLKQEIHNHIVFHSKEMKEYTNEDDIKKLLDKNEVIIDVCKEFIYNITYYLIELMKIDKDELNTLINDKKNINYFFENKSLIDKIDIYDILFYIRKTAESYAEICDNKKRRDTFLKDILLYEEDEQLSVLSIYSNLITWFKDTKWYNNINFKDLPKKAKDIFFSKDSTLECEIENQINHYWFDDLIGEWGEVCTIDFIDSWGFDGIDIIIEDNNNSEHYTLIVKVYVETQTYSDHDYYPNGTVYTYVSVSCHITQENKVLIDNLTYLGRKIVIKGFE